MILTIIIWTIISTKSNMIAYTKVQKKNNVTAEPREEANEPMLNESANSRTTPALSHKEVIFSDTFVFLFLTLLLNSVWVQTISGLYKVRQLFGMRFVYIELDWFQAFGQTFIVNDFFLATVNSLAAGCNCLSRVFWGHFADKTSYETTMSIACAVGAALMWTLGVVKLVDNQMLFMLWVRNYTGTKLWCHQISQNVVSKI